MWEDSKRKSGSALALHEAGRPLRRWRPPGRARLGLRARRRRGPQRDDVIEPRGRGRGDRGTFLRSADRGSGGDGRGSETMSAGSTSPTPHVAFFGRSSTSSKGRQRSRSPRGSLHRRSSCTTTRLPFTVWPAASRSVAARQAGGVATDPLRASRVVAARRRPLARVARLSSSPASSASRRRKGRLRVRYRPASLWLSRRAPCARRDPRHGSRAGARPRRRGLLPGLRRSTTSTLHTRSLVLDGSESIAGRGWP